MDDSCEGIGEQGVGGEKSALVVGGEGGICRQFEIFSAVFVLMSLDGLNQAQEIEIVVVKFAAVNADVVFFDADVDFSRLNNEKVRHSVARKAHKADLGLVGLAFVPRRELGGGMQQDSFIV